MGDSIPDPRHRFLKELIQYEREYTDHLVYLKSKLSPNTKTIDDLAEDLCEHVNLLSKITHGTTHLLIDIKMNDVLNRMMSSHATPELNELDFQIECKLMNLHSMMTDFNQYTEKVRQSKLFQRLRKQLSQT